MADFDAVCFIELLKTTRVSWANFFFKSKNWPQKRGKTSFLRCADLIEIINNIVLVRDADLREVIKTWHQATKDHLKQFKQQYYKTELQLTAQYKYSIELK